MKIYFNNKIYYITLISISCILDQFSKIYINLNQNKFLYKEFLIFKIELVRNYGAAFNIFTGSRLFLTFISVISAIILTYFIFINESRNFNKNGLSFILAGTIGNGIDRIFNGYVIDFIKIKFINFPIFNIADIAINIGILFLTISYLKNKK
tara:strand:+ start:628 stop:1083 length:456 start_codon:yes stop_codon:yes gene_type:complete